MKSLFVIFAFLALPAAHADQVVCTLATADQSSSATADLAFGNGQYALSNRVYDLSFNLVGNCESSNCFLSVTVDSKQTAAQLLSLGFEVIRPTDGGEVFRQRISGPDQRDYQLYCNYYL